MSLVIGVFAFWRRLLAQRTRRVGTTGVDGKQTGVILGYIALVFGVSGVRWLVSMIQSDRERLQRLSAEKKAVASDDGKIKITSHPALQDEISGTENGMNLVFLHTTLADGDHFQQILAWTLKSRWQK